MFISWWILSIFNFSIIFITKIALKTKIFIWLPIYIAYLTFLVYYPFSVVQSENLGFSSIFFIMIEGIRLVMKAHSYFRTKLLY